MFIRPCFRTFFFAALFLTFCASGFGQSPAVPSVEAVLDGASKARAAYLTEFRDLISEETKTLVVYDKNNEVKKKRVIVSTFIVYRIGEGDQGITEFRNVRSADGKPIADTEKRSQDFLDEIAKAKGSGKGLAKIEKEGSRFDDGLTVSGMTLFQAAVLAENLRPLFAFHLDGQDTVNGHNVFVVSYRQTRESPYISTRPRTAPDDGKMALIYDLGIEGSQASAARVNGRLWIDRETFQIVKETRILTTRGKDTSEPANAAESVLEYGDSAFGILTPVHITFTQYRPPKDGNGNRKDAEVILDYGKFARANVDVKVVEIK